MLTEALSSRVSCWPSVAGIQGNTVGDHAQADPTEDGSLPPHRAACDWSPDEVEAEDAGAPTAVEAWIYKVR